MKRWPIGLALIGTLLAVGIGVCAGDAELPRGARELPSAPSNDTSSSDAVEHVSAIEIEPESISPTRAAIDVRESKSNNGTAHSNHAIEFVVRDVLRNPIQGARAQTLDDPPIVSGPTNDAGQGELSGISASTDVFRVLALGYRSATRAVESGAAPLEVTLTRMPGLTLLLERRDRGLASELSVELALAEKQPFVTEEGDGSMAVQLQLGAPAPVIRSYDRLLYRADAGGRLYVPGLDPKKPVIARVEDITGRMIADQQIEPACFQSNTPVVIAIDEPARALEIRVVDEGGKPISRAKIRSRTNGALLAKTRAGGVARIDSIYAPEVDLRVEALGFASSFLDGVQLNNAVEYRNVVLTRGRSIHVRVADSSGRIVPAYEVEARLGPARVGRVARCADEGCYRIDQLPETTVVLSATVEGMRFSKDHDTYEPSAVIEIPTYGSVSIQFAETLSPPTQFEVRLSPVSESRLSILQHSEIRRTIPRRYPVHSLDLPIVFSGRYTLNVTELQPANGAAARRCRLEEVIVRAGERTVVHASISR